MATQRNVTTHCNTLQHTANALRHIALQHTATQRKTHCNTLQHTANALRHIALQHTATQRKTHLLDSLGDRSEPEKDGAHYSFYDCAFRRFIRVDDGAQFFHLIFVHLIHGTFGSGRAHMNESWHI